MCLSAHILWSLLNHNGAVSHSMNHGKDGGGGWGNTSEPLCHFSIGGGSALFGLHIRIYLNPNEFDGYF